MERIQLHNDIKALSDFRANMTSYLDQIHKTNRPLVITQNGISSAVVMNVGAYESMMERLELLEDIQQAEDDGKKGRVMAHETARKKALYKLRK